MGLTAENLAEKFDITREEQDAYALRSQERAFAAMTRGGSRTRPCRWRCREGPAADFAVDEYPRRTSLAQLAALKPHFKEGGTVTPGTRPDERRRRRLC